MRNKKLPSSYYLHQDVVHLAKDLIGKELFTKINGVVTSGMISETEAYAGIIDKASHAYNNRRTPRTEVIFGEGGNAYVYLCYGIHHLFNIVTHSEGTPHAVLIRGIIPFRGLDVMIHRRKKTRPSFDLASGPGTVSEALGIKTSMTGTNLNGDQIWLEEAGIMIPEKEILTGPRIGVDYAEEDASLPYRFYLSKERSKKIFEALQK